MRFLSLILFACVALAGPNDWASLGRGTSLGSASVATTTDILAGRYADWVNAGMSGGIPSGNTLYTNIGAGASSATVQAAIDACPSNGIVQLASGTYNWSGNIRIQGNGVELRGSTNSDGWPTTVIYGSNANWGIVDISTTTYPLPPSAGNIRNLTGSLAAGATSMVCTSAPTGLTAGMIATVDELDWGTINGGYQGSEARVGNRNHFETFLVTDVTSSTANRRTNLAVGFRLENGRWP